MHYYLTKKSQSNSIYVNNARQNAGSDFKNCKLYVGMCAKNGF